MSLPTWLSTNHSRFAFAGDEWLIAYAHLGVNFVAVYPTTFSFSMVVELYLKAYAAYLWPNEDATKYSHDLIKLYSKLQTSDPVFPDELRLHVELARHPIHELDQGGWQSSWYLELPEQERMEIRQHYEVFLALGYAADLKYGIAPPLPRNSGRVISSAWSIHNPWLVTFVAQVRRRIKCPQPEDDRLAYALEHPELHPTARLYLLKAAVPTINPT